jgi:hypothetical protein
MKSYQRKGMILLKTVRGVGGLSTVKNKDTSTFKDLYKSEVEPFDIRIQILL